MDSIELIEEYLKKVMLTENVREWMIIVNKGLLGNKRVVYSTDKRDKVREKFEWYRDMYPEVRFRIMTKSSFRAAYHRFPEYLTDKKREQLFGTKEREIKYGQNEVKKKYVFSPKSKEVEVSPKAPVEKEIIRTVIKEPQVSDTDEYVPTRPTRIKRVG